MEGNDRPDLRAELLTVCHYPGSAWRFPSWSREPFKLFSLMLATCQHHPAGENLAIPKLAPEAAQAIHFDVGNLPNIIP
jgi:hypothetical protein